MATRAFVEPATSGFAESRSTIQYFTPSYSLYPVLAAIHGARSNPVPLQPDFGIPKGLFDSGRWDRDAALTFITTPNAPSGKAYSNAELEALCRAHRGAIILDEAYVDFARQNALELALKHPHVLIARTFSKAYSLCFLRVGYFVGHPDLIAGLQKIRDSYNVNGLGQIAALTTLSNLSYYRANFRKIIATRQKLTTQLRALGFEVFPSETNFILARPPDFPARQWLEELRRRKILVRWFDHADVRDYLRITIGTDGEAAALVKAARQIISNVGRDVP